MSARRSALARAVVTMATVLATALAFPSVAEMARSPRFTLEEGTQAGGAGSGSTDTLRVDAALGQPTGSMTPATDAFTLDPGIFGVTVAQRVVAMDVRPGVDPARIDFGSRGRVPVAFLADPTFDPLLAVERSTLTMGVTGTEESLITCAREGIDVDGDGRLDLLCDFDPLRMGFEAPTQVVRARGWSIEAEMLRGMGAVLATTEAAPPGEGPDADGDGVADAVDSCPAIPNADRADFDCDRVGDACDSCRADWNPSQADADADGIGDACDYAWGDVGPTGAPDGVVTVSDLVLVVRFWSLLDSPGLDAFRRANVAPAAQAPPAMTPTEAEPQRLDGDDVRLIARALLGRGRFTRPEDVPPPP